MTGRENAMDSKILSRRDLAFLLYEWLDVTALTQRPRYADHDRATFDAVLDVAEQMATDLFAPHNRLKFKPSCCRTSSIKM